MASDYDTFAVLKEPTPGDYVHVGAGVDVAARKEGAVADLAESPLTTNSDGEIVAGTFTATTVGDVVIFRVENVDGLAGTVSQTTT